MSGHGQSDGTASSRPCEDSRAEVEALLRSGPFHEALRAAIAHSGLTLEALRGELAARGIRLSLATLSYWQHGRSRPERTGSMLALRAIENILRLPAHSLRALLGPPRPRGRWLNHEPGRGIDDPAGQLAEVIGPVLGPSDRDLRVFSQEDIASVGPDRAIHLVRTRTVLRALADGPDRHLAVYRGEPGTDSGALVPVATENCRLGRTSRHPAAPIVVAELLFDRRMRAGETHLLEYEFRVERPVRSVDHRRTFRYPAGSYVASVRFSESAVPVRCRRLRQGAPAAGRGTDELTLVGGRSVHLAVRDVPRGVLGIAWDWD
ncbi:hypothetical protein A8924_5977 [Saccharopolyspora erythraea NRRL 2338]|uniref:Uncharacterized protein n=3 Tax=Saccharopolyspora erythraea TaxID=1836 RepID=A4FL98_SACEN|nr:hypothetical protein [Saccharopolyspora erythraea]EQD85238.1 hypothetical protein N599_16040 [Saccharopolyspora erythraea D]PFG98463.1 hypothetical protein A8924_5977 [Saccharopolyspora erythraea NRRL 2338]QRK88526.1 hypothetical protein JQX30_28265 [Saccharopolyspora erythraea]CAM04823.1 hypothetical protein SACE_5637 [Saccharopolyspora erythraea NRRL 2338]